MSEKGWQCPDCGRRFPRRTREHSCQIANVDDHLRRGSPEVQATFHALLAMLRKLGEFQLLAVKTMLVLRTDSNFGGITVRKTYLDVGFILPQLVEDPRIVKTEKLSATKIACHVHLTSAADVDRQLEGWFREALVTRS
jgi:Domain of unknown function (DUF5655)